MIGTRNVAPRHVSSSGARKDVSAEPQLLEMLRVEAEKAGSALQKAADAA